MSVISLSTRAGRGNSALFDRLSRGDGLGLAIVLAVQTTLSLSLHNTAFEDEALYVYAGHQQIDHLLHASRVYDSYWYISGFPWFYPPIAGFLDGIGGLALVRLFSLVCLLAATLATAGVARNLFGRRAGLPAAIVFAVAGPVLFVGHLATFDALCIALLAGATLSATIPRPRCFVPGVSVGTLLALAFLAKYVALLFAPSVVALALLCVSGSGWKLRRRLSALVGIGTGAAIPLLVAMVLDRQFIKGFVGATLSRHTSSTHTSVILESATRWAGPTLAIAAAGLVAALAKRRFVALLLFATGLIPVVSQTVGHELTSLQKHVAYGIFFLAPLAGLAVSTLVSTTGEHAEASVVPEPRMRRTVRAARSERLHALLQRTNARMSALRIARNRKEVHAGRNLAVVALAALVFAGIGQRTANALYNEWPSSSRLVTVLRTQVRPASGRYLVEESEVPRFYLRNLISPWQWTGTFWFQYKTRSGQLLTGTDAYRQALRDRYFAIVALRYGPTAPLDRELYQVLKNQHLYRLITRVPLGRQRSDWFVWRST